ncbi:MAG: L-histidine N(alpha)-methyltransferase [Desulfobacterales bacterium]|nr:L-histidine N(alpha)-methyltransferase [Desulfobacterales bacterium]
MKATYQVLSPGDVRACSENDEFASDLLYGLSQPVKSVPSKYLYDETGSRLFCRIMELPEYYPTRCETEILLRYSPAIIQAVSAARLNLVELGAGDGSKTRILINELRSQKIDFRYVPIDISESAVSGLCSNLSRECPEISVNGLVSDYFVGVDWLSHQNAARNLILFLGSNIGNFSPSYQIQFLSSLWNALNHGDYVLIGMDLKKDAAIINQAYNDAQGVTAAFNLNLLSRINRELGGDFGADQFTYYSAWDAFDGAVKSCLLSKKSQSIYIDALCRNFSFDAWEPFHTESSYKFTLPDMQAKARHVGFEVIENYSDARHYFVDSLWRVIKQ